MPGANVIKEFFASLGLEVDEGSFKRGEEALGKVRSVLEAGAVAFAGFSAAIGFATHQFIEQADTLGDWSALTGASVENLDALRLAAKGVGSDVNVLIFGMTNLSRQLNAIGEGRGKAAGKALKEIGLSAKDLRALPISEAFEKIQLGLAGIDDASKRTALSSEIFGARFARTLNTINPETLKQVKDEALALGIVMSKDDVEAGEALNVQLTLLGGALQSIAFDIVRALLPAFQAITLAAKAWFGANQAILRQRIERVFRAVGDALVWATKHAKMWIEVFLKLVGGLDGLATILKVVGGLLGIYLVTQLGVAITAFGAFVAAISAANLWLGAMQALLLITPFLVGALAVVIFLFVDELVTRLKGGQGIIDDFFNPSKISPTDNALVKMLREVLLQIGLTIRGFSDLWTIISEGPTSTIGKAAIKDLKDAVHLGIGGVGHALTFGAVGPSQEERARFLEGLPLQQPTDVVGLGPGAPLPSTPTAGGGLLSALGGKEPGAPSVQARGSGGNTISNTITIEPIVINGAEDPEAVGAAVQRHISTQINQAAERLQGGG